MTSLKLTQLGNPILRKKSRNVLLKEIPRPAFQKLIRDMFETIKDIGVGLAAPQIGKSIQLAVIDIHPLPHRPHVTPTKRVLINPRILSRSKRIQSDYEGCLSFSGICALVPRSSSIVVSYYDENGKRRQEKATGFFARVLQHEIDHLNGTVYVDHIRNACTFMTTAEYEKRILKK